MEKLNSKAVLPSNIWMNQLGQRYIIKDLGPFLLALLLLALRAFASQLSLGVEAVGAIAQAKKSSTTVIDLFRNDCARWHGADGRGDAPLGRTYNTPAFTEAEWWQKSFQHNEYRKADFNRHQGKGGIPLLARS